MQGTELFKLTKREEESKESKNRIGHSKNGTAKGCQGMDAFSQFRRESNDADNGHKNSSRGQHSLKQEDKNPRFVLEPDIDHVRNPGYRDAVQEEPPEHIDAILDVTIPRSCIVRQEKPEFRGNLPRPREKPTTSSLFPETRSTVSLDPSTREHGWKETTRTKSPNNIGVVLEQFVPSLAIVEPSISVLSKRKAARQTPILGVDFNHEIKLVDGTDTVAKWKSGACGACSKGMRNSTVFKIDCLRSRKKEHESWLVSFLSICFGYNCECTHNLQFPRCSLAGSD